jgi:hypothetical protein
MRPLEMAEGVDHRAVLDHDAWPEENVRFHNDIAPDLRIVAEEDRRGGLQGGALRHRAPPQALLDGRLGLGELGAVVDALDLVLGRRDRHA